MGPVAQGAGGAVSPPRPRGGRDGRKDRCAMKRIGRLGAALFLVLLLAVSQAAAEALPGSVPAAASTSAVYINDQRWEIAGYNIEGSNYFRIRDLAAALAGTSCRFDVAWNQAERQVELTAGRDYAGQREERSLPQSAAALPFAAGLLLDGRPAEMEAYNINGSSYYKLRDLGDLLSFEVRWLEEERSVCVYTELGGGALLAESGGGDIKPMNREKSTQRWAQTCTSYLWAEGETVRVFNVSEGEEAPRLTVDTYSAETYDLLDSREIPMELDLFGGFYPGESFCYIAFGSNNTEEDSGKEVIRIVKYDQDFQRLGAASVTGGESAVLRPFDTGTLRMCENGNELVVHTSRALYAAGGWDAEAAQLTLVLDTEAMAVENDLGPLQGGYVSRSLNQFVQYSGGEHVLVDQGDADPRSVILYQYDGRQYTSVELLRLPGDAGASCTGVTVGGFEVSGDSYLTAINTVDHQLVEAYTDYTLEGLSPEERDVVLLVCPRDGGTQVEQVRLTDYVGQGKLGSTPYLVKLEEDRFLVLWEEFSYYETEAGYYGVRDEGVRWVEVNGSGQALTGVRTLERARLSYDCQPAVVGSRVMWYVNSRAGRIFYFLDVESGPAGE